MGSEKSFRSRFSAKDLGFRAQPVKGVEIHATGLGFRCAWGGEGTQSQITHQHITHQHIAHHTCQYGPE